MVGKIKRVRQKLHHDAVKINTGEEKTSSCLEKAPALPLNITTKTETRIKPADKNPRDVKVSGNFNTEVITVVYHTEISKII